MPVQLPRIQPARLHPPKTPLRPLPPEHVGPPDRVPEDPPPDVARAHDAEPLRRAQQLHGGVDAGVEDADDGRGGALLQEGHERVRAVARDEEGVVGGGVGEGGGEGVLGGSGGVVEVVDAGDAGWGGEVFAFLAGLEAG
ncbi:hypothetical protein HO133_002076 [Letharia lupina]|uniref:Uncharacterized protein n=1 Tax=Letharia lupina TaxID=560253 RepID=A0A8H6CDE3_9LECA|nr:uncharacterized protein HO133_002076 [Letharia lupina]KAF6221221.1 hypothetical protein HO133_002076 [Letharia lupina]